MILDNADAPVSGAALMFSAFSGQVAAISDAAGSYDVRLEPFVGGIEIRAEKSGYERTSQFLAIASDGNAHHNIRLYPIVRLAARDSLRLSINPDDPMCGFEMEYRCRTIRISTGEGGRLTVTVVPDRGGMPLGLVPSGEAFPRLAAAQLFMTVAPNAEVRFDVLAPGRLARPEPFTLQTSLVP